MNSSMAWTSLGFLVLCSVFLGTVSLKNDFVEDVRQNLDEKSNSELILQMAAFQKANLAYMAYASYFSRASINLPGFRKYFLQASEAAFKNSQKVIDYINMRGGYLQFQIIDMNGACAMMKLKQHLQVNFPGHTAKICRFLQREGAVTEQKDKKKSYLGLFFGSGTQTDQSTPEDWKNGKMALTDSLMMERSINSQLLDLVKGAKTRKDAHLRKTIEDEFLEQQTKRLQELTEVITRLRVYSEEEYPLGEYIIDLEMEN